MKETIFQMERYAEANNIPIIEVDSIKFIMKYIKVFGIFSVLAITAPLIGCGKNNKANDSISSESSEDVSSSSSEPKKSEPIENDSIEKNFNLHCLNLINFVKVFLLFLMIFSFA